MNASPAIGLAVFLLLFVSCRKHTAAGDRNYTAGNPATEGSLLVMQTDAWTDGATNVTTFDYDAARRLTVVHQSGNLPFNTYYFRDSRERIYQTLLVDFGDSDILNVYYADTASGKVAYTLRNYQSSGITYVDSEAYVYNKENYPVRISVFVPSLGQTYPGSYDSFTYDGAGNLSQYQIYDSSGPGAYYLNIGYQFQYDNKINPLFSYDDARLASEWNTSFSPNNLVKQTNIYGDPAQRPSDDVTLTWHYRSDQKPDSSARGGTAISTTGAPVVYSTYYYQ